MEGNSDGKALKCAGLCVEFNNVMYVAVYRTSCVKGFSSMRHSSEFLAAIANLMREFAIHDKKNCMN